MQDIHHEVLQYKQDNPSFTRPAISNIVEIHGTILCITQMNDVLTPQNGVCFTIMLGFTLGALYAHITSQLEDTYVCI